MKLKNLMLAALCASASMAGFAQSQGYMDGIEYYKAGQYDNAREILTRTLNDGATDKASALYYLGQTALRDGNTSAATEYFNQGISANSKNGLNYVGLGAVALKKGDSAGAANQFKAATKAENTAPVMVAVARAYYNQDPVAYAKEYNKYLDDAFKKDKKCTDVYIMRGDVAMDQNDPGEAAGQYDMAIYYNSNTPEAYVKYASAYIHVNPQYAIDKLNELNRIAPNSALAQRELAEKYYENDQLTRAAQQYGTYIQNPNHFVKDEERYAQLLYFGGEYDKSINLASSIIANDQNNFAMHRMLFLNKAAKKDTEGAMQEAQTFFQMTPPSNNHFTANDYTTYADLLSEQELDSLAAVQYEKAIIANPDKPELFKGLSSCYYNMKDYARAAESYRKYVDSGTGSTNDTYVLAGRYMSLAAQLPENSTERAEAVANANKYIDIVLEKVDNDYRIPQRKARILIVGNNGEVNTEVVSYYEKALALLDQDPENQTKNVDAYREIYGNVGSFYFKEGNKAKARPYFENLYKVSPSDDIRTFIDKNLK
jgi:Tfp pilus assembly protein PilF